MTNRKSKWLLGISCLIWSGWVGAAPENLSLPRFRFGNLPELPPLASSGGLVAMEAKIAASGIVVDVRVLLDAPPYTEILREQVLVWRFEPAEVDGRAVASRALVMGIYRAPVLMGGDPPEPKLVIRASEEVPFPIETETPDFPPTALYKGTVFLELAVDAAGQVTDTLVLRSANGFVEAAVEAASRFRFEPARRDGKRVPSHALLLFGFPQPLTPRKPPRFP